MAPMTDEQIAAMAAVTLTVERRSGDTFAPSVGGTVKPGEAVLLLASGVGSQTFKVPEFIVQDEDGNVLLDQNATVSFGGEAAVYWQAPLTEGTYLVRCIFQSKPFLPFTDEVQTLMVVTHLAPKPPPEPPAKEDVLGSLERILKWGAIGAVAIGAVVVVRSLTK